MIAFDEAVALIEANAALLGTEDVALAEAAGRVLAQPLHARSAAPRVAVAAMDGYAVIDAATRPGEALQVVGESRAGEGFSGVVAAGQAVRIFTGAPMPAGADRCIMQEYASRDGERVRFAEGYGPGWHVRAAGSDFAAGDLLLGAGTRLTPRAIIAAAAADEARLTVARRPRVSIIGTGDELAPPGEAHLHADAIPESVTHGVAALIEQAGASVVGRTIGLDDLPALEAAAGAALTTADLVIVTGGASVGERDFAKPMFAAHGLELVFAKVAIKPGKPVWMARAGARRIVGLPGNPTSAMVTARLFLAPLLAGLAGRDPADAMMWRSAALATPLGPAGPRETLERARWDDGRADVLKTADSGAQAALIDADILVRRPAFSPAAQAGETVLVLDF